MSRRKTRNGPFSTITQRIAKGAGGKGPRQKTSKIVKKCQKVFRHFLTIFAQGKKRQKSSKSVKNVFDTFRQFSRGTFFPAPFAIRWITAKIITLHNFRCKRLLGDLHSFPGRNYIPPPLSGHKAFSWRGCIFWGPTWQDFYTPHPPFIHPPSPRGVFSGVGVYKIWPCILGSKRPFALRIFSGYF